jgi:hypothetical protein
MQALAIVNGAPPPRVPSVITAVGLSDACIARIRTSTDSARARAAIEGCSHSTVVRIRLGAMHLLPRSRPWVRVSDDTVEEIRVRHEESAWSYGALAKFYGLPRDTVVALCKYRRR